MSLLRNRALTVMGACLAALFMCANPAHATLIASEDFNSYSAGKYLSVAPPPGPGNFNDLNAGTGWSTPFRSHIGAGLDIVISDGLTGGYFNGAAATVSPNNFFRDRIFSSPTSNSAGTVVWQSMQLSTDGSGTGAFRVNNSNGGQDYVVGIDGTGKYTLTTAHSSPVTQTSALSASLLNSAPDVVLVRTESLAGGQFSTSFWVSPNFAGGEAGLGAPVLTSTYAAFAGNANIGEINIRSGNNLRVDEVLFGTSLADVAQVVPAAPAPLSIGWQFVQRAGAQLLPHETAGLTGFEQANWNADGPRGQVASGSILNLTDQAGLSTNLDVNWVTTAGNSWTMHNGLSQAQYAALTPDQRLNDGFLNQQATLSIADIPQEFLDDGYSLIVYYNNNEGPANSNITVEGSIDDLLTRIIRTGDQNTTRFDEFGYLIEDGADPLSISNVTIFESLNDPSFFLRFTNIAGQNGNNGITGFQIVRNASAAVPEPATAMLLGLAVAGLSMTRRSRRETVVA